MPISIAQRRKANYATGRLGERDFVQVNGMRITYFELATLLQLRSPFPVIIDTLLSILVGKDTVILPTAFCYHLATKPTATKLAWPRLNAVLKTARNIVKPLHSRASHH